MTDARTYQDWVAVHSSSTDYEADLVRDRLDAAGVDAVVLTQRDHAFNLNVGQLAPVHVMVRPEDLARARQIIAERPFTEEELTEAALAADPEAEDAHSPEREAMLDSGMETLRLSPPREEEGDEEEER